MSRLRVLLTCVLLTASAAAPAALRAVVVSGLGGEQSYETRFQRDAGRAADALRGVGGEVTLLRGDMSRRDVLMAELRDLVSRCRRDDVALVVLIGHGTYDERSYRFNLPGPDLGGADLADLLGAPEGCRQVVVAATSASGALRDVLGAEGRTLVTATRSGGERNASVFAGYLVTALEDPGADLDKDGYVSLLEAFRFAEAGVASHYHARGEMQSEHPQLSEPAAALLLARLESVAAPVPASPRVLELEQAIAALRQDKANRDSDSYYAELQRLLLELAMVRRQTDPPPPGGTP